MQGLSNPQVFCVAQDSLGFLWFGTDYGLNRFDGKKFSVWQKENGLPGNSITALCSSSNNELVMGCYNVGIAMKTADSFQLLSTSHIAAYAQAICEFQNQFFLASATFGNLSLKFTPHHFDSMQVASNNANSSNIFRRFLVTRDNQLLMTGGAGIFKWNGKSFEPLLSAGDEQPMDAIAESDRVVYAGIAGKILMIKDGKVVSAISRGLPPDKMVHRILFDHKGRMWISVSGAGLYLYDHGNMQFMNPKFGIGNVTINDLYLDRENNIWICTFGEGIYSVSDFPFLSFTTADGLPNNFTYCFASTSRGILCGTFTGLGIFQNGKFEEIKLPLNSDHSFNAVQSLVPIGKDSIVVNFLTRVFPDHIEMKDEGQNLNLFLFHTRHVISDSRSSFLLEAGFWLLRYHLDRKRMDTVAAFPATKNFSPNGAMRVNGNYYFATNEGLFIWNGKNFQTFNHINGLTTDKIYAVAEDHHHAIWLGSDAGIFCLKHDSVFHFTKKEGLPDNNCTSITVDKKNNLWVTTSAGISRFNGANFFNYSTDDGLIGNAVNAVFFDSNLNRIWIGTMSGISMLELSDSIQTMQRQVPVYITGLRVNNNFYGRNFPLKLPSSKNNLSFQFIALNYANPDEVVYRYRLAGLDSVWQNSSTNEIQFASLKPGNYTFTVQALNSKGEVLSTPAMLSFQITPSLLQTDWFRTLLILIASLILFLAFYFFLSHDRRRRQLISMKKQSEHEKEIIQEMEIANLRQQALNAMMNPHFVFNALGSIQHYMNQNDKDSAAQYLSSFARLIRKNLNSTRKAFISLEEELEQLKLYLEIEKMRLGEKLQFTIEVNENVETDVCLIPTMLLQPVVENAIVHGLLPKQEGGKIFISIEEEKNNLRIVIEDDGIGMAASVAMKENSLHQSLGLEMVQKRLQLLSEKFQKSFTVQMEERSSLAQRGARVIFLLPLLEAGMVTG